MEHELRHSYPKAYKPYHNKTREEAAAKIGDLVLHVFESLDDDEPLNGGDFVDYVAWLIAREGVLDDNPHFEESMYSPFSWR